MGKKSGKSRLRTERKRMVELKLQTNQDAVKKANDIPDPLEDFPSFRLFDKNGIKASLECLNIGQIDKSTFEEIFNLEKDNMKSIYNSCSWGWDEKKKYKEMTEDSAKYLIARNECNEVIGFSHFRFDMDYGEAVLYCYELQLNSKMRKKGLGKFILQALELMAFKNNMKKVVLTVLKHNLNAVNFFYSLNYKMDESNPEEGVFESIPYQILSKLNIKLSTVNSSETEQASMSNDKFKE